MTTPTTISATKKPSLTSATIAAAKPATTAPTSGTNAPENVRTASGSARGTPSRERAKRKSQTDQGGVEKRDDRRSSQVTAERVPRSHADLAYVAAVLLRGEPDDPSPEPFAVSDEEEQEHDREKDAGDHLERDDRTAEGASGDRSGACSQLVLGAIDELADSRLREPERSLREPLLYLFDAALDAQIDVVQLPDGGRRESRQNAA
jgi:hypothetical protein